MTIDKHILVVRLDNGPAPELSGLDVDGVIHDTATTLAEVDRYLRSSPVVSLVIIDSLIGHRAASEVLDAVKAGHPELPVLWIGDASAMPPVSSGHLMPDSTLHRPFSTADLQSDIGKLVQEERYSARLVDALVAGCSAVMREAYDSTIVVGRPLLQCNYCALEEVNAIVPFCGRGVAGALLVSTAESYLAGLRRRLFPDEQRVSRRDAEDMAGEMANMMLGRAQAFFASRNLPFAIGVPILIGGSAVRVRYPHCRPALVLAIEGDGAALVYVTLYYHAFDPLASTTSAPGAAGEPGDLTFL